MKKRKKTKIKKSTLAVIAFLIFIAIMIVISILNNENTQTQTKPPAREYFKIEDVVALGTSKPGDSQNQTIKVEMLSFKITPIKGDAHFVSINPGDDVKYEDWPWFSEIKRNETKYPEIWYPKPVMGYKTENGYAITIRISCEETSDLPDDQKVTIYAEWIPM